MRTLLVSADLTADEIPATGGHRRFVPGPAIADVTWMDETNDIPAVDCRRWKPKARTLQSLSGMAAESRQTGCFASGENRRNREGERPPFVDCFGETAFGEGGFSPVRFHLFSLCPKACYISSPAQHAEFDGYSPSSYWSRDEPPITACGGNFIGGEISRNEQCPHEADLR